MGILDFAVLAISSMVAVMEPFSTTVVYVTLTKDFDSMKKHDCYEVDDGIFSRFDSLRLHGPPHLRSFRDNDPSLSNCRRHTPCVSRNRNAESKRKPSLFRKRRKHCHRTFGFSSHFRPQFNNHSNTSGLASGETGGNFAHSGGHIHRSFVVIRCHDLFCWIGQALEKRWTTRSHGNSWRLLFWQSRFSS